MKRALALLCVLLSGAAALAEDVDAGAFRAAAAAAPARRITDAQAQEAIAAIAAADLPAGAAAAFERLVTLVGPGFVPPEVSFDELDGEAVCAKVVSRLFWQAFGREDDLATARGVSGNAWDMSANVRLFGGQVLPWNAADPAALRPGDILGLHYALSIYNSTRKPVPYTHVALVVAVTATDGPLVVHCWRPPMGLFPVGTAPPWPVRIEFLRDLLSGYPDLFRVCEVIRPRNIVMGPDRPSRGAAPHIPGDP